MIFNINSMVRVKLTDEGRKALLLEHIAFWKGHGRAIPPYEPIKEDYDGWSTWQLWSLMNQLGPYVNMGMKPVFEMDIDIIDPIADKGKVA